VIAPLYEYLQTPGVRIYRTVEEFIALVTEALACDTPRERQLRQEAVRDCTWDVRAREVANLFRRLLEGQNVAQAVLPGNRASGLRPGQDIVSNETGVRSGW